MWCRWCVLEKLLYSKADYKPKKVEVQTERITWCRSFNNTFYSASAKTPSLSVKFDFLELKAFLISSSDNVAQRFYIFHWIFVFSTSDSCSPELSISLVSCYGLSCLILMTWLCTLCSWKLELILKAKPFKCTFSGNFIFLVRFHNSALIWLVLRMKACHTVSRKWNESVMVLLLLPNVLSLLNLHWLIDCFSGPLML